MPRLTNPDYLTHRRNLVEYWEGGHVAWAELLPQEQLHLHEYYEPSKQLSDERALAHRAEVSKQYPSLPQQAGKAYKAIMSFQPIPREVASRHISSGTKRRLVRSANYAVKVRALARPDPDPMRFARAIVDYVYTLSDDERAKLVARTAARTKGRPGRE